MKSDTLNSVLTGVLAVTLILSVFFCLRLVNASRETRRLAFQVQQIQAEQARFQQLAAECLQYSQTHPAIDPILEAVKLKEPKSGTKPAAK